MEPKESCNFGTCHDAAGVFDVFYSNLPPSLRAEIVARKFAGFKEGLERTGFQCEEKTCLVLLQLLSIAESYKEDNG